MSDLQNPGDDRAEELDRLLKDSFRPGPPLSGNFEDRVMESVRSQPRRMGGTRLTLVVMLLYWAFTSLISAWLLSGGPPVVSSRYLAVLLPVIALTTASLFFLLHEARLRLSDLFLRFIGQ